MRMGVEFGLFSWTLSLRHKAHTFPLRSRGERSRKGEQHKERNGGQTRCERNDGEFADCLFFSFFFFFPRSLTPSPGPDLPPPSSRHTHTHSFSPFLFRDEQRRARVVTLLGRRCARLALLGLGFISVRYEDVAAEELPAGYPSFPPVEDFDGEGDAVDDEDDVGNNGGGKMARANGNGGNGDGDGDGNGDGQRRRKVGRRTASSSSSSSSSSSPPLAAGAIVSNHCGWIDVLIHMAAPPYRSQGRSPPSTSSSSTSSPPPQQQQQQQHLSSPFPSFVARASTDDLPLIGVISRAIGCLYVDRTKAAGASGIAELVRERVAAAAEAGRRRGRSRSRSKVKNSSSSSSSSRKKGSSNSPSAVPWPPPLLLFPEGTTTNGRYLLRFKTGAFLAGEAFFV